MSKSSEANPIRLALNVEDKALADQLAALLENVPDLRLVDANEFPVRAAWLGTATARHHGGNARRLEAVRIRLRSSAGCDVGQSCAIGRQRSARCSRR